MSDLRNAHLYNFGGGLTEWGKKIRALRIRKGITLYQMAKSLGVGSAYLSGVECGRKPQEPEFMVMCEDYLNALPESGQWSEPSDFDLDNRRKSFDELMEEIFEEVNHGN
ncbi:helix-turn-helix domain-containing protein [Thorsellia kenyensis]|uniref:Helix-turn-helix domain-containing protein n=1 Tax=Thorsellia kenyensis TaxID=1549888 RepID=A0ABV6CAK9_9GAMM